jgi:hypothetical protein
MTFKAADRWRVVLICFAKARRTGRGRYDDLALICRDAKTFDEFRARAPKRLTRGVARAMLRREGSNCR